uniref:RNA polymerase sigma factor n=1 Tax=Solirubrobacter deserti TaxID=2282478 RepID=UPI001EEDB453
MNAALREHAPRVLATLIRRHGDFARCEDAVQEALLEAYLQWEDVPEHPFGWLLTVASRRLVDGLRADASRAAREERVVREAVVAEEAADEDDTLALLLLCCHPSLAPSAQIPLTLRAFGGLTTEEIARALLTTPATIAQRIVRAKARLRGVEFGLPPDPPIAEVAQVLYLIFNEGHMASSGAELRRDDLAAEAIRLARELRRMRPVDAEVAGLLALMLLHDARRSARTAPDGSLVPLEAQDRSLWDAALIAEGVALTEFAVTAQRPPGPYALQAAIVAVHAEAPDAAGTDWPQILALYDLLLAVHPNPVTALNRAVAVGEVHGPAAGLTALDALAGDPRLDHRLDAVRGHFLARAGDRSGAADAFERAAAAATQDAERAHLAARAAALR